MKNCIYLIPCTLNGNLNTDAISPEIIQSAMQCHAFITENIRSTRRYLRKIAYQRNFDEVSFFEFQKDFEQYQALKSFIQNNIKHTPIGILSEAGCPGIADPGAIAVAAAHQLEIEVKPLSGPSSIILTLMASGFNGQSFAFNGYLPIDKAQRAKKIQQMEYLIYKQNQTQIFIETPYRNNQLLQHLTEVCKSETKLCIASQLGFPEQSIAVKSITEWKRSLPDLHKKMTVFALYK